MRREVDDATDLAERSGVPAPLDALVGVYADPPAERPLWSAKAGASWTNTMAGRMGTFSTQAGEKH